jgi:hypothetical protein
VSPSCQMQVSESGDMGSGETGGGGVSKDEENRGEGGRTGNECRERGNKSKRDLARSCEAKEKIDNVT